MTVVQDVASPAADQRLLIISADAHVGPRLVEDLRRYCEKRYLEEFDAFAAKIGPIPTEPDDIVAAMRKRGIGRELTAAMAWNQRSEGHYNPVARLHDMDSDGIAAEVLFHGSQNFVPLPFDANSLFGNIQSANTGEFELLAAGRRIYNRWLADFCASAPGRFIGLAQLPIWDLEASIREVEWAASAGLGGINFPAADAPGMPPLDDELFETFYATCAEYELPLTTHISAAPPTHRYWKSPYGGAIGLMDSGWWCRRSLTILTLMGAFERHPGLRLVLTEHPGAWLVDAMEELDSIYDYMQSGPLRANLPRRPSEYIREHVWIGASFQSRPEAEAAVGEGYSERLMWGSDYPHAEGTWCYQEDGDDVHMTHVAIANTYHDLPLREVRGMLGDNALQCYTRLDRVHLAAVAERIGAPRPSEVLRAGLEPKTEFHNRKTSMAFRTKGHWA
ncbi:amidohydrolase family protein [Streptomyces sp. NPDC001276]|uniref:amidohydrolase family protein n=1 Tax=Streptomyces sp. NPDC001276 TaxID=3364555 RepID=UPI003677EDD0